MPTKFRSAVEKYLHSRNSAPGTQAEYRTTLAKWKPSGDRVPIERLSRKEIREFLDCLYDQSVADEGMNAGRTANKAHDLLCSSSSPNLSGTECGTECGTESMVRHGILCNKIWAAEQVRACSV